ncbi:hypothetical protein [Serratia fonticola]|uniref:hypothetical protein n=1 Tax=Serratia fonticola TaxID=47917 RepID=UPI00093F8E6D|nr:hypothetical protein [Serratia fonticola]OKP28407.1 hypothetical protein BSQ40_12105 [Serratia fonticola]
MFKPLDPSKAATVNPFYNGAYTPPQYVTPGTNVTVAIESREMELAILAAYDYGIDALSEDGRQQLDRLIADLKFVITGR